MHQDGAHVRRAGRRRAVDEGEDGEGVLGHSHVRPLGVVILDHRALVQLPFGVALLALRDKRDSTLSPRWAARVPRRRREADDLSAAPALPTNTGD